MKSFLKTKQMVTGITYTSFSRHSITLHQTIMTNNTNGNAANGFSSDHDLESLATLLDEASDEHADQNLAEILARLDSANSVAQQMEDSLDQILKRLDGMLEGIQASQPTPPKDEPKGEEGGSVAKSQ